MVDLVRCVDQWGREIVLTVDRWQTHILPDHPELLWNEAGVVQALTNPTQVMFDKTFRDRENYYRPFTLPPPFDRTYLKVCARFAAPEPGQAVRGTVVTAYSANIIKPGERQKWP